MSAFDISCAIENQVKAPEAGWDTYYIRESAQLQNKGWCGCCWKTNWVDTTIMPISFQLNYYFQFENFNLKYNVPFEVVQYILYTAWCLIEFLVKFGHFHLFKDSFDWGLQLSSNFATWLILQSELWPNDGNTEWKQMCSVRYHLQDEGRPEDTHASAAWWKEAPQLQPVRLPGY